MNRTGVFFLIVFPFSCNGLEVNGVEFPDGVISFADRVVEFKPGGNAFSPYVNVENVIGLPDHVSGGVPEALSLGDGGELIVQFTNNALTSSGNSLNDLWIFEIGGKLEPIDVYISQSGVDWISVGTTQGGTGGIDIDEYIGQGVEVGVSYSFVKVVDRLPIQSGSPWAGADIDAIGAISSTYGACGTQEELKPATYDEATGELNIPYVLVEDRCYKLKLNGSSGLGIEHNDVYMKLDVMGL